MNKIDLCADGIYYKESHRIMFIPYTKIVCVYLVRTDTLNPYILIDQHEDSISMELKDAETTVKAFMGIEKVLAGPHMESFQ